MRDQAKNIITTSFGEIKKQKKSCNPEKNETRGHLLYTRASLTLVSEQNLEQWE